MLVRVSLLLEDKALGRRLRQILSKLDVIVDSVRQAEGLWDGLSRETADLVVLDQKVLRQGGDLLQSLRELPDAPDVAVITPDEDAEERADLLSRGCVAVLNAGLPNDSLRAVLEALIQRRQQQAVQGCRGGQFGDRPRLTDFVSDSPTMQSFLRVVERVAASNTTLLILGETGVGKERLARAIHAESLRGAGPFIAINCAALAESLLESELFGHEEGSFTGATRSRRGCFELAHRGTLFLDEIGEMPLHLQSKLLRVLQERELQRVGGERTISVDVRVMAASNRDIRQHVDDGTFRQDLFYRLSVVSLTIPPLRERQEDIPALIDGYINYFRTQIPHTATSISPAARDAFLAYAWPGNVRELINVVERAMLLCQEYEIGLSDLPEEVRRCSPAAEPTSTSSDGTPSGFDASWCEQPLHEVVERVERTYLVQLLQECEGRVGKVAERAEIDPRVLYEKMKRFGLNKSDYRRRS